MSIRQVKGELRGMNRVSTDRFLDGRLLISQVRREAGGFRSGHDAVLLASAISFPTDGNVDCYELGSGVGVVSLCVASRLSSARIVMIEIDSDLVALARSNIIANGFSSRVSVVCGDVSGSFKALSQPHHSASHVFMNPPFYDISDVVARSDIGKRIAHQTDYFSLLGWFRCAASLLGARGRIVLIYHAAGLMRILPLLERHFGDLRILPIYARSGGFARRVIIGGILGSRAPLRLLSGLVLHDSDDRPSARADAILRDGAPLDLWGN